MMLRKLLLVIWLCSLDGIDAGDKPFDIKVDAKGRALTVSIPADPQVRTFFFTTDVEPSCESKYTFIHNDSDVNGRATYAINIQRELQKNDPLRIYGVYEYPTQVVAREHEFILKENGMELQPSRPNSTCNLPVWPVTHTEKAQEEEELIFEDNFDSLDLNVWRHEMQIRLGKHILDNEFVAYTDSPNSSYVENGFLYLKAIPADPKQTNLELERCTSTRATGGDCRRHSLQDLPPVHSAKIYSYAFSFTYGRVEIRAKLPKGDFLFPYILLQGGIPENALANQLRIYARGNVGTLKDVHGLHMDNRVLHGSAVRWENGRRTEYQHTLSSHTNWSSTFHTYTLNWLEDRIEFKVDNISYGVITNPKVLQTFTKCYLVLGLTYGGGANFPVTYQDYPKNFFKTRKAAQNLWERHTKLWEQPELVVDYIRVYSTKPQKD